MKKILLISRGVPDRNDPMWGNFELDQAKALVEYGHKVVIISIDQRIRFYKREIGISRVRISDINMYNYFLPFPYGIFPKRFQNLVVDYELKRLLKHVVEKEGKFDIVHGHYLENIRLAVKVKEFLKIPAVGTEHWSQLKKRKLKTSVKRDAHNTYSKLDQLIAVSHPMRTIIKEQFGVDSIFVGCVVDNVFKYVEKEDDGIFRFLAVGSLFKIKGFDIAIKAFAAANFDKKVELHIIGEGQERKELEELILKLNLIDQVILHGRKNREYIMEIMKKSSAYVMSSRSENFATACMEALSAGLPTVMTKCGGPEDFVDASNSILVEVDNIAEMSNAMKILLENRERYNRKSISDNIKSKYSAYAVASQLTEIYNKL